MLNKLIAYNHWANRRLFDALKHGGSVPPAVTRLVSHIVVAEAIWLGRIAYLPAAVGVWVEYDLDTSISQHEQSHLQYLQILSSPAVDLKKVVSYVNTQEKHFENNMEDILMHLINHGTYHRAQVATEMRKSGLEPVNTDYITYVRLL